jgi:hypothetical protein
MQVRNIAATIALCAYLASTLALNAASFVVAGAIGDGRIQVFAIQSNGEIRSRWKISADPNSGWTEWSSFQSPVGGVTSISVGSLSDKRMQLFATQSDGNVITCWKISTNPNSQWTPWTPF